MNFTSPATKLACMTLSREARIDVVIHRRAREAIDANDLTAQALLIKVQRFFSSVRGRKDMARAAYSILVTRFAAAT